MIYNNYMGGRHCSTTTLPNNHCCKCNCCNPCQPRIITPEGSLPRGINNSCCSCCRQVIPPVPTGIVPPLTPLPPPVPPVPPGRVVIGEGVFEGIPTMVPAPSTVVDFTGVTEGIGISHTNGTSNIILINNILYECYYTVTITTIETVLPNVITSFLALSEQVVIEIGVDTIVDVMGTVTFTSSVSFITSNFIAPQLTLVVDNMNTGADCIIDSATLMIEAVQ